MFDLHNSFSKIDGFVEPASQIDGFGRTHRTRANGATVGSILNEVRYA